MRKLLLIFILLFFICSCKKQGVPAVPVTPVDKGNADLNKKYKLSFTLAGFTKETNPINTSLHTNTLILNTTVLPADDKYYAKIMYMVYDSTGAQVSRLEENLSPDDADKLFRIDKNSRKIINNSTPFGTITDSLKAGNYTLVVTAGTQKGGLNKLSEFWQIPSPDGLFPDLPLSEAKFYPSNDHNVSYSLMEDAFFYKAPLKVSTTNMVQTIVPERIAGQLSINIEDPDPQKANYYRIYIDNELYDYNIDKALAEGTRDNLTSYIIKNYSGEPNYSFSCKILNTQTPFTLRIEGYMGLAVSVRKTIPNVRINKGETTSISTKLFSNN
ncbi:MAG: hypothetical protein JWQ57_3001 [Mucilaginibacter sp.]|nr:hypothetical protein [Mucilaginibacter sp.]